MARSGTDITEALRSYIQGVTRREPDILRALREETAPMELAMMQISPEQGQFMALLARLTGAVRYLEVGTFTGYSALAMALALPPNGRIIACDINKAWTDVARRYWQRANVAHKIDLRLAPAVETLDALLSEGVPEFDFAFIDADKKNYDNYYERALRLVRRGGLIAIDNVLWSGKVLDAALDDEDTRAIRALNQKLHGDARIDLSLVPIGDGLTLAIKR